MSYTYSYKRPCVTCDTVLLDLDSDDVPQVLLVLRKNNPFKGKWALPGGFLEMDEELEDCATRELYEETGVDMAGALMQFCVVGNINRDPRTRIISVVYTAVVDSNEHPICASDDAEQVAWFRMDEIPSLAADHLTIIVKTLGEVYQDRC